MGERERDGEPAGAPAGAPADEGEGTAPPDTHARKGELVRRLLSSYGMILALAALCI